MSNIYLPVAETETGDMIHLIGEDAEKELTRIMWEEIKPALELQAALKEEARLRERYPALQSAWEAYQVTLRMVRNDPNDH